jgi:Tol biopolymer transport system component
MRISALLAAISFALATSAASATHTTYRAAIYAIRDDGTGLRLIAQPEPAVPDLVRSPGGRSILYLKEVDGGWALFAADNSGANAVRLTPPGLPVTWGTFSPDGRMIAFDTLVGCGFRCQRRTLYVVRRDGSDLRPLAADAGVGSWAPDSRRLAYGGSRDSWPGGAHAIYVTNVKSNKTTRVARGNVGWPQWAPRGERIAYLVNDGIPCFVNADGSRRRCTRGPRREGLVWSRDGTRVAFQQVNPANGRTRLGFVDSDARRIRYLGYHRGYPAAWSPDGKRLAFVTSLYDSGPEELRVLRIAAPRRSVSVIDDPDLLGRDFRWRGREISFVVSRPE